ncbi:MAG: hypothetical protein OEY64_11875 [Nitrospinota bacterium]|nr:hypothetical protein [Nitrospinota bacterium]
MNNSNKQKEDEKKVFEQFAKTASFSIIPGTLIQDDPPNPDIQCEIEVIGKVEFELRELEDQESRAFFAHRIGIQKLLRQEHDELPEEHILKSSKRLKYSNIRIRIKDDVTEYVFRKNLKYLWTLLSEVPDGYEGKLDIRKSSAPVLLNILHFVEVFTVKNVNGPIFCPDSATSIGEPSWDKVSEKFHKTYNTKLPLGLLLHLNNYPAFPDDSWINKFIENIQNEISNSQFIACWIYDFRENEKGNILFKLVNPPFQ